MIVATVEESRRIDELSQKVTPAELLMEAAGSAAAVYVRRALSKTNGRLAIVCGPGNNGGDGLVVARILASDFGAVSVSTYLVGPSAKRSTLFKVNLERLERSGAQTVDLADHPHALEDLKKADVIVDAIFGIGLGKDVASPYSEVIQAIDSSRAYVISLDTPSGLDADRGVVRGNAVKADETLTFGVAKRGFFVSEGPERVGKLRVLPIGFPARIATETASSQSLFGRKEAAPLLERLARKPSSNKARHGHALVLAGSPGTWGAGVLSAMAAFRVGAGYVTLASGEEPVGILGQHPEIMTAEAKSPKLWEKPKWTAAAVGPGLGTGTGTGTLELIEKLKDYEKVVLDADAITVIAQKKLWPLPSTWILTPHAGELSRITGRSAQEIEADRFAAAEEAAELLGCLVLLKGYRTVVSAQGKTTVVLSGNAALAKAGTGDTLTGFIVGLMAQGLEPREAALTGSYLHGLLADEWVSSGRDASSLVASDLADRLPKLLKRIHS